MILAPMRRQTHLSRHYTSLESTLASLVTCGENMLEIELVYMILAK